MEAELIEQYLALRTELHQTEDIMNAHFGKIVDDMLKTAKTPEQFIAIKERLRVMPECASKVLLFRKIILTQQNSV
jgi:hypothetical protein